MSDALAELHRRGPEPALESEAFGAWVLAQAGLEPPDGLITVAPDEPARRVPWARRAQWLIVPARDGIELWSLSGATIEPGENLAGQERDSVTLGDGVKPAARASFDSDVLRFRGALVRAVLMVSALDKICEMSIAHARERHQFGRPIGSFQGVQAHLVTIAQQAALVGVAVDAAVARQGAFEIAVAKLLAGRASITASRAAHQVHGARGVTREHPLGLETRRLWSWRCEYGGEREWSGRLGAAALRAGADRLYPAITAGSRELEA